MADHKFTLEEILNEYSEDGRRSGIRHTSDKPLSHGTLETEKLVNAATSSRPLRQEQAGYDQVVPELSAGKCLLRQGCRCGTLWRILSGERRQRL